MSVDLKQTDKGDLELVGSGVSGAGFVPVTVPIFTSSIAAAFFTADRAYRVKSVILRPTVAGTDGSAVTLVVRKAPSGTAAASGTPLQSGSFNLKGTINTNQVATLSTTDSDLMLANGDSLVFTPAGVTTAVLASLTVNLTPA